jgi:hypothetical protein
MAAAAEAAAPEAPNESFKFFEELPQELRVSQAAAALLKQLSKRGGDVHAELRAGDGWLTSMCTAQPAEQQGPQGPDRGPK